MHRLAQHFTVQKKLDIKNAYAQIQKGTTADLPLFSCTFTLGRTKSTNDAKTNHDALATKIDAVESKCDSTASTANTKITSNEAEITKLQAAVKTINESAEQAAATEVEVAASWQFVSNPILPTNRREAVGIRVVGKNFQQYDYSPDLAPFFECTFTLTSDASKKVVTAGQTSRTETATDPSFVVSCPSPVSIVTKSVFQLSLTWAGGEKPLKIPFNGAAGKDKLMFDMTWTALKGANGRIIVDVSGLDVAGKYVCVFTQPDNTNIRKTTDASFIDDVGRQLDCGPQPTGFAITGTSAAAIFELLVKGTKNKASYAGPTGAGPTVYLNTCVNGKKDGEETDTDCGGLCGGCQGGKACKAKKDCVGAILCTNNKCVDSDGMLKSSAGKSCAEILKLNPGSKSGLKWIDPDDTGNAFQVYCNQEDDGGGWILLQHIEKVGGNCKCCYIPVYFRSRCSGCLVACISGHGMYYFHLHDALFRRLYSYPWQSYVHLASGGRDSPHFRSLSLLLFFSYPAVAFVISNHTKKKNTKCSSLQKQCVQTTVGRLGKRRNRFCERLRQYEPYQFAEKLEMPLATVQELGPNHWLFRFRWRDQHDEIGGRQRVFCGSDHEQFLCG